MTNHQWTHYTLTRAYSRGIITATQLDGLLKLYRGLK
jgi:hypothetical protein